MPGEASKNLCFCIALCDGLDPNATKSDCSLIACEFDYDGGEIDLSAVARFGMEVVEDYLSAVSWKVDKYNRVVSIWKEQFQGFEIVIASANNGAVENVTREIPGVDAVDAAWLDGTDYFADFGTRLLDAPAWAMVAARLGNKTNRNEFTNRLWYGSKEAKELNAADPRRRSTV